MNKLKIVGIILGIVAICFVIYGSVGVNKSKFGSASSGLPSSIATSSNPTVGTTAVLLFATSTCASRVITTVASPVMLTFSDNQGKVPTAVYGHLQGASTTVVYDSGLYGCDAVRAYGFVSSAISVSESR